MAGELGRDEEMIGGDAAASEKVMLSPKTGAPFSFLPKIARPVMPPTGMSGKRSGLRRNKLVLHYKIALPERFI
jgi:hypothetical protein